MDAAEGYTEPACATTPPYLSLISAPKNYDNPNPLGAYQRDPRAKDGEGTWVAMIDSGFDLDRYPHVRLEMLRKRRPDC